MNERPVIEPATDAIIQLDHHASGNFNGKPVYASRMNDIKNRICWISGSG